MKVPPGYAVLACGAAQSLCGAKLVALMAQTCARVGKRVGDERDTEAIDESYHFRGIGNQIVSSFMKLRVLVSIDGKGVSVAPSVTPGDILPSVGNDHLIPWGCSIHLSPGECRLEIPSRGIDAKLLVTTSNHILVNLADFAGVEEPDHNVWISTQNECEAEPELCGIDEIQKCDHAEETEQWLSEDFRRQRCEVKARRDAKVYCKILTALGRREWKTWNDVPLELRKDIERIHRNLGHASADQLEKLFRDANVSDDAVSALKHFRCDACDRLKQPPSKRKVAVNHAETFNDIVSMDVNFWKITFKESPRVKTTLKVLNIVDAASGMHIAIQIADQTAETIWKAFATGWLRWAGSPRCLRVDPHRSQIARWFFDKAEGRGIFVEPTPAEAHWQMGQVENNARYLRQMGYRIVEDIDVSQSDFQTTLDELTDAKNSLEQHSGYMPRQWVFGLIPRVPGHMLEENSDLPNLDPEGRFRRFAEMRHKCRMAAIETEANAKIRKSFI